MPYYHCAPFHLGPREVDNPTTLNILLLVPLAARSHRTSKSCSSDLPGTCSSIAMRIFFMLDCSRWFSRIFNMSEPLVAQIISIVIWTCFCTLNHSDFPTPENIRRSEYAENWYNWRLSTRNWASTRTGWNCTWEIWWVWYKRPSCVNSGWNILHECLEHDKYFGSCRCIKDAYQIDIILWYYCIVYCIILHMIWYNTYRYIYIIYMCVNNPACSGVFKLILFLGSGMRPGGWSVTCGNWDGWTWTYVGAWRSSAWADRMPRQWQHQPWPVEAI